ncbi:MAG: NAD(P)-dependent oxidoreductase [Bacteroidetes bacterium]|nr:NAD(P)-dependent oxidoreductase [Bacteroidota bacterium]
MDNVLITGASGFIGSFLAEEGLKRDYSVFAGIRNSSSKKYLADPRIKFVTFDFSSVEKVSETLKDLQREGIRFRYIIHNAGLTKARKKEDYFKVNFLNTKNFILALQETDMVPEKFILISSLAAYGPGNPVTMEPVKLSDKPNPIEHYGKSKLEAEKFLMSLNGFPWLTFRPTGVYGPREKDYYVFFKTINHGFETYIGTSKQVLTFIYVKDLVRLVFDALLCPLTCRSYFVSDAKEYDAELFAAIVKKHLNRKTIRITVPSVLVKGLAISLEKVYGLWNSIPTLNSDKYSVLSSKNWRCEVDPLLQDFGFTAEYDLEKGVKETIEWYKKEGWLK